MESRGAFHCHFCLWLILCLSPQSIHGFGWLKVNSLSDRLMGSRPEFQQSTTSSSSRSTTTISSPNTLYHPRPYAASSYTALRSTASSNHNNNAPHQKKKQSRSTKSDQANMVEFMNQSPGSTVDNTDPLEPLDADTMELLHTIVRAADGRKADDIVALKVHHISTLSSVLVILSGNSRPQNQAIAAAIKSDVQDKFQQLPGGSGIPEGSAESGWMLLDYGTVMVHIMTPKSRLFYNVQGQWEQKGAVPVPVESMLWQGPPPGMNNNNNNIMDQQTTAVEEPPQQQQDEDDPFWS